MAHAAPQPPGRRRRDRVVGGVLAASGVAALVVAIIGLTHPNGRRPAAQRNTTVTLSAVPSRPASSSRRSSSPRSSSRPTSSRVSISAAPSRTAPPFTSVPLLILNNAASGGLAQTAASRFAGRGWRISEVRNYRNDIISTCAYYDAGSPINRSAALALQKQFPQIKRVVPRFAELPQAPIVVVIDNDYS